MNRLMLASLSVFALTIAATPSEDTIAIRPSAGDLNPQDRNNLTVDSSQVIGCYPEMFRSRLFT